MITEFMNCEKTCFSLTLETEEAELTELKKKHTFLVSIYLYSIILFGRPTLLRSLNLAAQVSTEHTVRHRLQFNTVWIYVTFWLTTIKLHRSRMFVFAFNVNI